MEKKWLETEKINSSSSSSQQISVQNLFSFDCLESADRQFGIETKNSYKHRELAIKVTKTMAFI